MQPWMGGGHQDRGGMQGQRRSYNQPYHNQGMGGSSQGQYNHGGKPKKFKQHDGNFKGKKKNDYQNMNQGANQNSGGMQNQMYGNQDK